MTVRGPQLAERHPHRGRADARPPLRLDRGLPDRGRPARADRAERHRSLPRAHGVQGHADPHRPADRRGDRGRRRLHQCLHRQGDDRLLCAGARGRRRPGARHPRRHRAEPAVRGARHRGRARGDPAGDRPGARHPGRHHLRLAAGGRLSRPAVRADDPRPGRACGGLRPADLSGFSREHYGPDRIILAAAGAVDPDALLRDCERLFGHLAARPRLAMLPARFTGGERRELRDLEQVHARIAFEAPGVRDDAAYAAQIYATAMGGGMSSRLFQELRERRGLCYTIFTQAGAYEDTGMITLYAGTGAEQIRELGGPRHGRAAAGRRRDYLGRARAGAGAAEGRAADGTGGPLGARRAAGADAERLGPGSRHRRDHRQDRRGDARAAARLRREPRRARPTRRWRCSGRWSMRRTALRWRGGSRPEGLARADVPPQRAARRSRRERLLLRLPEMGDHSAWAQLRRNGEAFLRPWEPSWSARPPVAPGLPQPRLLGVAGARGRAGAGAVPGAAGRRAADGGDHARQHPPRAGAVGAGRLLDRSGLRPAGLHDRGAERRWCTMPSPRSTSAGSRRPACRRTPRRGRCSTARASVRGGRAELPADQRALAQPRALRQPARRPARAGGGRDRDWRR